MENNLMRFMNWTGFGKSDPELQVADYIATRLNDHERGPQVWLHPEDARARMLVSGEIARVVGPRGQQVAQVVIDDAVPQFACVLRDVPGVDISEIVRVHKPDLDTPPSKRSFG
jgi:anaerobic selenocysteine-containing dehydrogenase